MVMTHFGDPCIHCGQNHDDVAPGPCTGDPKKRAVIQWRSLGVRHDNVEHFLVLYSDGTLKDLFYHILEDAPYWGFGTYERFGEPPPYDQNLRRPTPPPSA